MNHTALGLRQLNTQGGARRKAQPAARQAHQSTRELARNLLKHRHGVANRFVQNHVFRANLLANGGTQKMRVDGIELAWLLGHGRCSLLIFLVLCFDKQTALIGLGLERRRCSLFDEVDQLREQSNAITLNACIQRKAPHGNVSLDGIDIHLRPVSLGIDARGFWNPGHIDIQHQTKIGLLCESSRVVARKKR